MAEEERPLRPTAVLLFNGKRKSGKDFLTDKLQSLLAEESVIIRLSGPLKKCYAQEHGLDYEELLSSGPYKERHRLEMIKWSEELRYFSDEVEAEVDTLINNNDVTRDRFRTGIVTTGTSAAPLWSCTWSPSMQCGLLVIADVPQTSSSLRRDFLESAVG